MNEADSYDYLGITLDKRLTMPLQMDKVRQNVSLHVADTIYKMMISLLMTYCSLYLENSLKSVNRLQLL